MSQTKAQLISDLVQALNFTGTSSAPANGMYLSAANTISLGINSAELLTVNGTRILTKSPSGTDTTVRFQHTGNSGYGDIILDRTVNAFVIDNDPTNASNNQSYFAVKNKGATNFHIKFDGKIGIGTTNPSEKIHITDGHLRLKSSDTSGYKVKIGNAATGDDDFLGGVSGFWNDNEVTILGFRSGLDTTNKDDGIIFFGTSESGSNPSTRMTIRESGNVGIGTTSPDTLLHLAGADTAVIRLENTDTSLNTDQLIGGFEFEKQDPSGAGVGVVGGLRMYSGVNGITTYLTLSTSNSTTNNEEHVRITSDGLVGIGTTSPSETLDVEGTIECLNELRSKTGNDLKLNAGSVNRDVFLQVNDSTLMTVQGSTGNVGIGITSPDYRLSVEAVSGTDVTALFKSDDANAWIQIRDNTTTDTGVMVGANGDNLLLRAGSNTRMYIKSDGKVGIGTTSPQAPFHVKLDTDKHIVYSGDQGEVGSVPCIVPINDSHLITHLGLRGTSLRFAAGTGTQAVAQKMEITSTGVAIGTGDGTVAPSAFFHIHCGEDKNILYSGSIGEIGNLAGFQATNDEADTLAGFGIRGSELRFATGSSERFRITSDGTIHVNSSDSASGGRLYATGSAMYVQSGNGRQTFKVSDAAAGVNRTWELTTDGNLKAPAGKGIDFSAQTGTSATGAATDDSPAEVLSHYEEGTWTPVANFETSGSATVVASGHFTRVGRIVNITWTFYTTAINSPSGNFTLTGLPFSCLDHSSSRFGLSFSFVREWNTDMPNFRGLISGGTTIYWYKQATNSTVSTQVQGSDFAAGSGDNYLYGSATYMAA